MNTTTSRSVQFYDYHPAPEDFRAEIVNGLSDKQKTISPKFFYNEKGSHLFDAICELPEYYLTRTENIILEEYANEIAEQISEACILVEPGSGSSKKIRILLDVIKPSVYIPLEISKSQLKSSAEKLSEDYPWLEVHAACIDFTTTDVLPYSRPDVQKVVFFPGSTIGNFEPEQAIQLLKNIANMVGPGGGLLIGVDLKKDESILTAAYSDSHGVTAAFNFNLLERINKDLDANFELNDFSHHAFYNKEHGRMESHLVSNRKQTVAINSHRFEFAEGESIHTESSYKYNINEFHEIARQAGFKDKKVWTDKNELFSVHYLVCN